MQLVDDRVAAQAHALDLGLDAFGLDEVVGHVHTARCHQHRPPDGNAPGDSQAVDGESHSPSPNLSAISASKASMASCSCSPMVSMTTSLPTPAASIMTPMMLLALTRLSPLLIQTSQ